MRLPNGQGHDGCPLDDQQRGTQKTVGGTTSVMPTSESPGEGKQGHCIEKGGGDEVGVSSSDGPGDVRESSRDETNKFPDSSEVGDNFLIEYVVLLAHVRAILAL